MPLAAWFDARGAKVVLAPPEQSADLRDYYNKHTKTGRLDSRALARLPLLHPEGLAAVDGLGPACPLERAVRRRSSLVKRRTATFARIDALLELLGPDWADTLGSGGYGKAALAALERCADPREMRRLGKRRLAALLIRHSHGAWREAKADEARLARQPSEQIAAADERIAALYSEADPAGIVVSAPGLGVTLAAGILGRLGDPSRFANLAGARAFTGLVPTIDQSGVSSRHGRPAKAGDPGLREALLLAADLARKADPTFAARCHRLIVTEHKHHVSALCHLAAALAGRIAACWRNGGRYVLRDVDGTEITEAAGRKICAERYAIPSEVRQARRQLCAAKRRKQRTDRCSKKSTAAAPAPARPRTTVPKKLEH